MKKNVHALIIGIDAYPYSPLSGCVHDSEEIANYLDQTIPKDQLILHHLKDTDATKDNIVQKFKELNEAAKEGDQVFIHYSGHGSRERANDEWFKTSDGKTEVIVTVDSMTEDYQLDNPLADKELRWLIHNLAKTKADITLLLDCCHSGGGTRDTPGRNIISRFTNNNNNRGRAENNYIFSKNDDVMSRLDGGEKFEDIVSIGKHILLAGARNNQTAKELPVDGKQWGIFTYNILDVLKSSKGNISYSDLVKRASVRVINTVNNQNPQLESYNQASVQHRFLGGMIQMPHYYLVIKNDKQQYQIDAGSLAGLNGEDPTVLNIFEDDNDIDIRDINNRIGTAKTTVVDPERSILDFNGTKESYKATIKQLSIPKLKVFVNAENDGNQNEWNARERLIKAIKTAGPFDEPSHYVEVVDECEQGPDYWVTTYEHKGIGKYRITSATDERPLVKQEEGFTESSVKTVILQLEHIAKWNRILKLSNPNSTITTDDFKMKLYAKCSEQEQEIWVNNPNISDEDLLLLSEYGVNINGGEISVNYLQKDPNDLSSIWPQLKIMVENKGSKTLYFALYYMRSDFSITDQLLSTRRIDPGNNPVSADAESGVPYPIVPFVDDKLVQLGCLEDLSYLKLMVSTEEFHSNTVNQDPLERAEALRSLIVLRNNLVKKDWTTDEISIRAIKSPTSAEGRTLLQNAGIKVSHGGKDLSNCALSSLQNELKRSTEISRSANESKNHISAPPLLMENPDSIIDLGHNERSISRGSRLDVLELSGTINESNVSEDNPIEVELPVSLDKDELIIPIATDGELYYPVGFSVDTEESGEREITRAPHEGNKSNTTKIKIESIHFNPKSPAEQAVKRGVIKTFKIIFQKFVAKTGFIDYKYPKLSMVTAGEKDRELTYSNNLTDIKNKIKEAGKILLVTHGFVGETYTLLHPDKKDKPSESIFKHLQDNYDLILAYDYDSYNTSIRENGIGLLNKLKEAGIEEGHGKQLDMIVHSMGGLVSRYFIENKGGNKLINKIVICGTPNGGTPWPKVKDAAVFLLTLALNKIPVVGWPLTAAAFLAKQIKFASGLDVVTVDMKPNSELIRELDTNTDPGIPYTLLQGNTSLMMAKEGGDEMDKDKILKILDKQKLSAASKKAVTTLLFQEANDVVVSVNSVGHVNVNNDWANVNADEVACDHFGYFTNGYGMEKVLGALDIILKNNSTES